MLWWSAQHSPLLFFLLARLVVLTRRRCHLPCAPQRAHANDPALHTDKTMFSWGSLAPKMQRGGDCCVDHGFARQGLSAAWIWETALMKASRAPEDPRFHCLLLSPCSAGRRSRGRPPMARSTCCASCQVRLCCLHFKSFEL